MNGQKVPADDLKPGQLVVIRRWKPESKKYSWFSEETESGQWTTSFPCRVVGVLLPMVLLDSLRDKKRMVIDLTDRADSPVEFYLLTLSFAKAMNSGFDGQEPEQEPDGTAKGYRKNYGRIY